MLYALRYDIQYAYIYIKAKDIEFLRLNKITYIMNCAGDQIDNYFSHLSEYKYYTLHWKEFKVS